ncbi:MAG: Stk1 family PASTA domain-containing Ser/Thr kinase [Eubacterium sp.]
MDNYVGKRLYGRYEIQEIVGVGGMSVVYKAYDNVDDRIVAIKVLKEEYLNNEEFKRRFKNESKAIALLSHPNIVKVYDVNFDEKLQYIVMEYIDGITLKEYITKQGAITWNDALFFMTQILKAVQHAHDKGIVHRDIKPQNIILLPNGNIKVTDFGIARFSRSETKTLTEQAIGSVHYIAPEQAKGEYTDEKADIYSLGVVLYEMLAGSVPFEADSAVSVALMQLQADAKKLTDINPDIPVGLEQICIHAMEKNAMDRYQTATEMLLDIEEIIRNPNTTFNYFSKVDSNPTRIVGRKGAVAPVNEEAVVDEENDDDYDPDHKKKVISAIFIGIIVLIAAIVLLVMGIIQGEIFGIPIGQGVNATTVRLENFVGTNYDDIVGAYDYDFTYEYEKTDDYEQGIVIRQQPNAGEKVLKGSKVTLVIATSSEDIVVPQIYGYKLDKSEELLDNAGLVNHKIVEMSHETVAEGEVIYSDPKAGTVVSADQMITIYVSSGPSTTVIRSLKVPDVTGLSQAGARSFLEKYGFTNISFVTEDSEVEKGIAISQSPSAGSTAQETDTIKVIISSGVTTTTTQKNARISLTIKLPKVIEDGSEYAEDTITITLNGTTYTSNMVALDGNNREYSVDGDGGSMKIVVTLSGAVNATETYTFDGTEDKSQIVDFSSYSSATTQNSNE